MIQQVPHNQPPNPIYFLSASHLSSAPFASQPPSHHPTSIHTSPPCILTSSSSSHRLPSTLSASPHLHLITSSPPNHPPTSIHTSTPFTKYPPFHLNPHLHPLRQTPTSPFPSKTSSQKTSPSKTLHISPLSTEIPTADTVLHPLSPPHSSFHPLFPTPLPHPSSPPPSAFPSSFTKPPPTPSTPLPFIQHEKTHLPTHPPTPPPPLQNNSTHESPPQNSPLLSSHFPYHLPNPHTPNPSPSPSPTTLTKK